LTSDALAVTVLNIVGYLFLYAALAIMLQVPFRLLDRPAWGSAAALVVATAGAVFLVGRLVRFSLQERLVFPPYVYWQPNFDPWLRLLTGTTSALTAALVIAVFTYLAWRGRANPLVYRRTLFLVSGMASMVVATGFTFFLFLVVGLFWGNLIAALLVVVGLLLMLHGVLYEVAAPAPAGPAAR
jgi:hypothetical protein